MKNYIWNTGNFCWSFSGFSYSNENSFWKVVSEQCFYFKCWMFSHFIPTWIFSIFQIKEWVLIIQIFGV